jgi:hypothetical protein
VGISSETPWNCSLPEEIGQNKNSLLCLVDFEHTDDELDYSEEEIENSTHNAVSKCCSVTQIFDAATNTCQDGNFNVHEVDFYRALNASPHFEQVTSPGDLDRIEFTTGLLEDSDCPGAGRK